MTHISCTNQALCTPSPPSPASLRRVAPELNTRATTCARAEFVYTFRVFPGLGVLISPASGGVVSGIMGVLSLVVGVRSVHAFLGLRFLKKFLPGRALRVFGAVQPGDLSSVVVFVPLFCTFFLLFGFSYGAYLAHIVCLRVPFWSVFSVAFCFLQRLFGPGFWYLFCAKFGCIFVLDFGACFCAKFGCIFVLNFWCMFGA